MILRRAYTCHFVSTSLTSATQILFCICSIPAILFQLSDTIEQAPDFGTDGLLGLLLKPPRLAECVDHKGSERRLLPLFVVVYDNVLETSRRGPLVALGQDEHV